MMKCLFALLIFFSTFAFAHPDSEADVTFKGTRVEAEKLRVLALQGAAKFLAVSHHHEYHRQASSSDGFVQQSRAHGSSSTTHTACVLPEDTEAVAEAGAVIEAVRDQLPAWVDRIRIVRPDGSAAAKAVITLDNVYTSYDMSAKSLSTGVSAVITLAITLATQGTGTAFGLTGTAATVSMAASSAALGSLCSAAALQLVQCNGNLVKAASGLLSTGVLEGVVKASATAGANPILGPISTKVAMGLVNNEKPGAIFTSVVVDTVAQSIATSIGAAKLDGFTHKLAHGALGGAVGATMHKDAEYGAMSGAVGAVVAETIAGVFGDSSAVLQERALQRAAADGVAPTRAALAGYIREDLQSTINISHFGASLGTFLMGLDPSIGAHTGANALYNNFATSTVEEALKDYANAFADVMTEVCGAESGGDTDDEAEESTLGKARKVYIDPLKKVTAPVRDALAPLAAALAESCESGEGAYTKSRTDLFEGFVAHLTPDQQAQLEAAYAGYYAEDKAALDMLRGASSIAVALGSLPGRMVDKFLRYTGLTDKYNARAARHMVDDALVAAGLGAAATRAAAKGFTKATAAKVAEQVKAARAAKDMPKGKVHDYSAAYPKEQRNFVKAKEFEGCLSKPLRVVSYHNEGVIGDGRTLKWWMPISEANAMGTMEEMNREKFDIFIKLINDAIQLAEGRSRHLTRE